MPWLAALTQVGLRNVLPVNAHAVYMLPGTKGETTREDVSDNRWAIGGRVLGQSSLKVTCTYHSRSCSRHRG